MWMAADFVAIRDLIGAHDEHSCWLSVATLPPGPFLLGDPACDRIIFQQPLLPSTYDDPLMLITDFLLAVQSLALKLSSQDTLVIVLVGHGEFDNGAFLVSGNSHTIPLSKACVERVLEGSKGHVVLLNTACYSGAWKSNRWTLLAAAGGTEESVSIVQSTSGHFRGGIFTNALLAEHSYQFGIRAPHPAPLGEDGVRGLQKEHDCGKAILARPQKRATPSCLALIIQWMNRFCTSATFVGEDTLEGGVLPFKPLSHYAASLHNRPCVPPSIAQNNTHSVSATQPNNHFHRLSTLSPKDENELSRHVEQTLKFPPPNTASEVAILLNSWRYKNAKITREMKLVLLREFRSRLAVRTKAMKIAKALGWHKAMISMGNPTMENLQRGSDGRLQQQAEEYGCRVSTVAIESFGCLWRGAASWLARIWQASGSPVILHERWERAMDTSNDDMTSEDLGLAGMKG